MRRVFATTAALAVTLVMMGCASFPLHDQGSESAIVRADTQPTKTDAPESTEPPTAAPAEDSSDDQYAQMFRDQVSGSGSTNLLNEEVQDHGIRVAKSICDQLEAGAPMESIADNLPQASEGIKFTDDDLFAVIVIGVPLYCPQFEEAIFDADD